MAIELRLLDLFCGQGGASKGYASIFPDITGVDIRLMKKYPYRFIKGDASTFPLDGFDLVHASPPCQDHSLTKYLFNEPDGTGWLLEHTIERAIYQGVCYVVENVTHASLPNHPHQFTLCGASLGPWVRNPKKLFIGKHRKFWCNFPVNPPECMCDTARQLGYRMAALHTVGDERINSKAEFVKVMDIDWMNLKEMNQALPPYFTRFIASEWFKWRYGTDHM